MVILRPRFSLVNEHNNTEYADLLLSWRNDSVTRANSFQTELVSREQHMAWLAASFDNPNRRIYLYKIADVPVAVLREDWEDIDLPEKCREEISYTVAPDHRGKGIAKQMLAHLLRLSIYPITAKIKESNLASIAVVRSVGFAEIKREEGTTVWRWEPAAISSRSSSSDKEDSSRARSAP